MIAKNSYLVLKKHDIREIEMKMNSKFNLRSLMDSNNNQGLMSVEVIIVGDARPPSVNRVANLPEVKKEKSKRFKCPHCDYARNSRQKVIMHIKKKHFPR